MACSDSRTARSGVQGAVTEFDAVEVDIVIEISGRRSDVDDGVASISCRGRPPARRSQLSFRRNFQGDQFSERASRRLVPRRRRWLGWDPERVISLSGVRGGRRLICGRRTGAGGLGGRPGSPCIDWCRRRTPVEAGELEVARGVGTAYWTPLDERSSIDLEPPLNPGNPTSLGFFTCLFTLCTSS